MDEVLYKLYVNDREYKEWRVVNAETLLTVVMDEWFDPYVSKLYHGDVFRLDGGKVVLVSSEVEMEALPCVLILSGDKRHGRKDGRALYRCVPNDVKLPCFLVPYRIDMAGLSKVFVNKYVIMRVNGWLDGLLLNVLGDVNLLAPYCEYQLYCKQLFKPPMRVKMPSVTPGVHPNEIQWTNHFIFTIDSKGCQDFDDAVSILPTNDHSYTVNIYIANPAYWLDQLQLWTQFGERISSIYLPSQRRPMLPAAFTNALCTLTQNTNKYTIILSLNIENYTITSHSFSYGYIHINKNFYYDDNELTQNYHYQLLLHTIKQTSIHHPLNSINIQSSSNLISYLMILTNTFASQHTTQGVYRNTQECLPTCNDEILNEIQQWHFSSGIYSTTPNKHEQLQLHSYLQITSPMRKLVDLLNTIQLQQLSTNASNFYQSWTTPSQINYINHTTRSIKRVQLDCNLLAQCYQCPDMLAKTYDGAIIDKIENDIYNMYVIYIIQLKIKARITCKNVLTIGSVHQFKLHTFYDEYKLVDKIRLTLIKDD